jgi:hypothetical protein
MARRHKILYPCLILFLPFIVAGGGGDPDCNCFESSPTYTPQAPVRTYETPDVPSTPPDVCLPFMDLERAAALKSCAKCVVCECTLQTLNELKQAVQKRDKEIIALKQQLHKANLPDTRVRTTWSLKTVKVKRGWFVKRYVDKYAQDGADLQATRSCNGFKRKNPKIYPGDSLRICGWSK